MASLREGVNSTVVTVQVNGAGVVNPNAAENSIITSLTAIGVDGAAVVNVNVTNVGMASPSPAQSDSSSSDFNYIIIIIIIAVVVVGTHCVIL
jgi:hypothetical protein